LNLSLWYDLKSLTIYQIGVDEEKDDKKVVQSGSKVINVSASRKSLLCALLLSLATSQVVYSNIATFLPPFRTAKYQELTGTDIGIVLA
jgi:hypothetical protein